jgi:hypothetical protein
LRRGSLAANAGAVWETIITKPSDAVSMFLVRDLMSGLSTRGLRIARAVGFPSLREDL